MRAHVGVDIEAGPVLFKDATKTIGRDREISLGSADDQLLTDVIQDGNGIVQTRIGKGGFGSVVERHVNSNGITELASLIKSTNASTIPPTDPNCPFATKIIKSKNNNQIATTTLREFVLRNLDDPGVVKMGAAQFHHDTTDAADAAADPNTLSTFITMDRAKNSLAGLIDDANTERTALANNDGVPFDTRPMFAINEYKMLAYQAIRAVAYLHSERIIHGDIKTDNTLVFATKDVPKRCLDFVSVGRSNPMQTFKVIQLTDFGLAQINYVDKIGLDDTSYTIDWRPPEFLFGKTGKFWDKNVDKDYKQYITPKSDIWALGLLLYNMATNCDFTRVNYHERTTVKNYVEVAQQMLTAFGSQKFDILQHMLPGFNTVIMNDGLKQFPAVWTNPWKHKELAYYPGLEKLLRRMIVVDFRNRADAFELMQDPFFTVDKIGDIFDKAMHIPPNKFVGIPYYPGSLTMRLPYVLRHMMKSLPSKYDQTHSLTTFNQATYRHLACQIAKRINFLCNREMKEIQGEYRNILESKVMALAYVWCRKNFDNGVLDIFTSTPTDSILFALISIALKTLNYSEKKIMKMIGCQKADVYTDVIIWEYRLLGELDFDLLVSAPYDFIDIFFRNVQDMNPNSAQIMKTAADMARNLLRVLYVNPAIVGGIDTIQIIDSVLDICVRSQVDTTDLPLCKSFDPDYSQLKLDDTVAERLIETIRSDHSYAMLTHRQTTEITDVIVAYTKSHVVFYK